LAAASGREAVADEDKSQAQGETKMNRMKRQLQEKGQQHGTDGVRRIVEPEQQGHAAGVAQVRVKEAAITIAKRLELAFAKAGQDEDLLWVLDGLIEREGRFSSLCGSTKEVSLGNLGPLSWDGLHCVILSDGSVLVSDMRLRPGKVHYREASPDERGQALSFKLRTDGPRWGNAGRINRAFLRAAMRGESVSLEYPDGHWRLVED
jgi:hypothetical protein